MNDSKIAVRYAKALFNLADEKSKLEQVFMDVLLISKTLSESNDLLEVIKSPIISSRNKRDILIAVFDGKVDEITNSFLGLICENKREAFLERIIHNFIEKYRNFKGITSVVISTAIQIDEATKSQIVGILRGQLKGNIELNEKINEDIIGGFILTFENKQLDVSTSSELRKIKRELLNATLK